RQLLVRDHHNTAIFPRDENDDRTDAIQGSVLLDDPLAEEMVRVAAKAGCTIRVAEWSACPCYHARCMNLFHGLWCEDLLPINRALVQHHQQPLCHVPAGGDHLAGSREGSLLEGYDMHISRRPAMTGDMVVIEIQGFGVGS